MGGKARWIGVALLLLLLATTARAWAHANLLQANPVPNSTNAEPPSRITLRFTETLDPSNSGIELLDGEGQTIGTPSPSALDRSDPAALVLQLPTLADGVYTVSWRALSAVDGHLTRGAYGFIVGEATEAAQAALAGAADGQAAPGSFQEASPLGALARVLTFIGGALLAGGFALHLVLWRPLRATLPLDEGAGDAAFARLLAVGLGLVTAGTVLLFVSQFLLLGSLTALRTFLLASSFGTLLVARFGLLAIIDEVSRRAIARDERAPLLWGLLFSALLLGTISVWSHSAAVPALRAAALLNDWLHLLAASIWIGGLAHFLFVGVASLRALPPGERAAPLATLIRRFSPLGICAVATLAVTGLYSGWLHVGSLEALRTTAYGQTLLVKLLLSLPLIFLAALNLLYWRRTSAVAPDAQAGFARTLGAETMIGLGVLAVVGVLTALSPARGVMEVRQSQTLTLRQPAGPLQATLAITPPQPGPAQYEVTLLGPDGVPYDAARRVRLLFTPPDRSVGESETLAEPQGDGRYLAQGAFLSLPGPWQVELQVQRPDGFDAFASFNLDVSNTIRAVPTAGGVAWAQQLPWALLAGGVAITLYAFWLRLRREYVRLAPFAVGAGVLLLAITAFQFFDPLAPTASATANPNPIVPTESSIARGEQLYGEQCQSCHGPSGFGDGPQAAALNPPPANLHQHVPFMADGEAFRIIAEGVPGTAMPAHKGTLPEEDHWHIVNYLRRMTGH